MNTGLDALAHALEGFWSRNHQPISDQMARQAIRLVLDNLEAAWRDGSDLEARTNMSLAALFGGLAFALPKTAGSHACSYPLSEDYGLPHGEACAFTLDSFVRINADERLEYAVHGAGALGHGGAGRADPGAEEAGRAAPAAGRAGRRGPGEAGPGLRCPPLDEKQPRLSGRGRSAVDV